MHCDAYHHQNSEPPPALPVRSLRKVREKRLVTLEFTKLYYVRWLLKIKPVNNPVCCNRQLLVTQLGSAPKITFSIKKRSRLKFDEIIQIRHLPLKLF